MKTIFGTTEKSNFILNMKTEKLNKYIISLLMVCAVLPLISGFAWLMSDSAAFIPSITLMASGFISILLFLVCVLKGDIKIGKNLSYIFAATTLLLAIIANMTARDPSVSTFGNNGRFEGVTAIFAYIGIFLLASAMPKGRGTSKIFYVMIFAGVFEALIGILQMISAIDFPSHYKNLSSIAAENIYLPSGTTGSPIFLSIFLTMLCGIALAAACYEKKTAKRFICGLCVILFAGVALCTNSLTAPVGLATAFVTVAVIEIIRMIKNKDSEKIAFIKKPIAVWCLLFIISSIIFALMLGSDSFKLLDMGIAYQDSFNNLFISGTWTQNMTEFYPKLWGETVDIIKQYPVFGTGLDCLYIPQMHGKAITSIVHSFDKCYNDYLYIAATRGIISLAAYLGLLAVSLVKIFGSIKSFFKNSENWYKAAVLASVLTYMATMFFGVSTIMVAPYFFILLGLANAPKLDK